MGHHHGTTSGADVALVVVLLVAGGYLLLSRRAGRRNPGRRWSRWRTASFLTGLALLAVALSPPVAPWAHDDFRGHMVQHMLVGMYAPLGLVLGAPVTLLLRTSPTARGRALSAVMHSAPVRLLTHPAVALLLSNGSLVILYFTSLYDVTPSHPAAHRLVHAHFLASGCLFAYVIAGPDPAPARPGARTRLVYLGCAIAVHAVVAQLLYGGFWTDVHAPVAELRAGAEIMYYFGDIAELLLAAALVTTWRVGRAPARVGSEPSSRWRCGGRTTPT